MFTEFLYKNITVTDYKYQAVIMPFIADFVTNDVIKYQLLTIELLDDNTIFIDLHDTEKPPSPNYKFE